MMPKLSLHENRLFDCVSAGGVHCRPIARGGDFHDEPPGRHDEPGGDGRVSRSALCHEAVLLLRSRVDHAGRSEDLVRQQRLRQLSADRRPRGPQGIRHGRHARPRRDRPHLVAQSRRDDADLSRRQRKARDRVRDGRSTGRQASAAAAADRRRVEPRLEPLLSDSLRQELQGDLRQGRAVLPHRLSDVSKGDGGEDVFASAA